MPDTNLTDITAVPRRLAHTTLHPETIALHLYQTTSFQFAGTAHAGRLFALEELGNIYTRVTNPTVDALEQRIARLEGGVAALAVASGQGAPTFTVLTIAQAGDNIVSSTDLYGGTWALFANTLKRLGIEVRFVDPADPEAFARASDDRTRAYYAETLPNPKLEVFPVAKVAAIGRRLGIPLIMDKARRRADALLQGGYGGLVGFELAGGADAGRRAYRRSADRSDAGTRRRLTSRRWPPA